MTMPVDARGFSYAVPTAKEVAERKRLLAMSEAEARAEGLPVWYQQMRYLREMEAAKHVADLQAGRTQTKWTGSKE
jgi:hypothetical protein